jgi:carboxypeptidase D
MYPEFAVNNTYGIKAYNDTVYEYAKFAWAMPFGCKEQIEFCRQTNHTTPVEKAICAEAGNMWYVSAIPLLRLRAYII